MRLWCIQVDLGHRLDWPEASRAYISHTLDLKLFPLSYSGSTYMLRRYMEAEGTTFMLGSHELQDRFEGCYRTSNTTE